MFRRLILGLIVCVTLSGLPQSSYANQTESVVSQIRNRGVLRVGTTGDYKPFTYRASEHSPFIGADIEMAQRLARRLQVKLELVPSTWGQLLPDLLAQKFDIAMGGVSITEARSQQAFFSLPYLRDGKTPIARCDEVQKFQTVADIDQASTRLIVNPGGTNFQFATQQFKRARLTVYADNNTIFDQIVAKQADLMVTDAIEARLQQQLKPSLCAIHPETPFTRSYKAYMLPRDAAWKTYVDQWLREENEGTDQAGAQEQVSLDKHLNKWLQHPWPRSDAAHISFDHLRDLMLQRLSLMEDVAAYKWNKGLPIEDLQREQQVIAQLSERAAALGIEGSRAEIFFRVQIEAAKMLQRAYFEQWRKQGRGKFDQVPSLEQVTRPKLDQLTNELLQELARTWPALVDVRESARFEKALREAANRPGMQEAFNFMLLIIGKPEIQP